MLPSLFMFSQADATTTPTSPENLFWNWLLNQGTTIVFLCIGIFFVGKALLVLVEKLFRLYTQQIRDAKNEIEDLKTELIDVRRRLDECEHDRKDLRFRVEQTESNQETT